MNKYTLALILVLASGGLGYYLGSGNVRVEEKIVKEKGEVQIREVEKVVTITKIVRPDGTVEETRREEDKTRDEKQKSSNTEILSSKEPMQSQYSLGLSFRSEYSEMQNIIRESRMLENYTVDLGRRILGPIWVEVGAGSEQYTLGVRVEL
jgi:hypothetical protein